MSVWDIRLGEKDTGQGGCDPGRGSGGPVRVPPAVRAQHAEPEHLAEGLRVPPCARQLEALLGDRAVGALDLAGAHGNARSAEFVVAQCVAEARQVLERLADPLLAPALVGTQLVERSLDLSRVEQDDLVGDPPVSLSVAASAVSNRCERRCGRSRMNRRPANLASSASRRPKPPSLGAKTLVREDRPRSHAAPNSSSTTPSYLSWRAT